MTTMPPSEQLRLFPDREDAIVNVASVPQRSPFRYPGGKTWLVPRLRRWLMGLPRPSLFIEPFAGGAISTLTVAAENLADHVVFVELDQNVAAVWQTILHADDAERLAALILSFEMTLANVEMLLSAEPRSTVDRAFQTIVRNRVNRGGILAAGAGLIKLGESGKGLRSRWYPETLAKRIYAITAMRDRLTFIHGDGPQAIRLYVTNPRAAFFVDPPYTASFKSAGSRLYTHFQLDHQRLFQEMDQVAGDFLMTYDKASEVLVLANSFGFDSLAVAMKNTHHAEMSELLIGRDLNWARRS
jgi:DNA adenine methylase